MDGVPLSEFLADASDYNISPSSIPVEVKIAILKQFEGGEPDPAEIGDTGKEMSDFGFNNQQYLALTQRFNSIALKHNSNAKKISAQSVVDCETVKDCIDLVTKAAS